MTGGVFISCPHLLAAVGEDISKFRNRMGAKHTIAQCLLQSESTLPPHLRMANVATGYSQDFQARKLKVKSTFLLDIVSPLKSLLRRQVGCRGKGDTYLRCFLIAYRRKEYKTSMNVPAGLFLEKTCLCTLINPYDCCPVTTTFKHVARATLKLF